MIGTRGRITTEDGRTLAGPRNCTARRPATAADLLDAPDPSAELRRLREQVAAARTQLAAILAAVDSTRGRYDATQYLLAVDAIDEAARGGLEALR